MCLAAALAFSACTTTSCKTFIQIGLVVRVVDPSGAGVCNAVVTATDGSFSEALGPGNPSVQQSNSPVVQRGTPNDPALCGYSGVAERVGTYSISVTAHGVSKIVPGVRVTAEGCHVKPVAIIVALTS